MGELPGLTLPCSASGNGLALIRINIKAADGAVGLKIDPDQHRAFAAAAMWEYPLRGVQVMAGMFLSPGPTPFGDLLARAWWLPLLRGILAVLFAVASFVWPGLTLLTLVMFFAAYAIVDGVVALTTAIRGGAIVHRAWFAIAGVIGIAAGLAAFAWPRLTGITLVMIIGVWSILRGMAEIAAGVALRKYIRGEWLLIVGGAISILFGLALIAFPGTGALALLWLIAFWAFVFGVLMIGWAFWLRSLGR